MDFEVCWVFPLKKQGTYLPFSTSSLHISLHIIFEKSPISDFAAAVSRSLNLHLGAAAFFDRDENKVKYDFDLSLFKLVSISLS